MRRATQLAVVACLLCLPPSAAALEWELAGFVAGDLRVFAEAPKFAAQESRAVTPGLIFQPELRIDDDDRRHRFTLIPFLRLERDDPERRHFDLREAHWQYFGDRWDLLVGVGKVYWGVAESRHLLDVVNQVDAVEDIDEEDRLGQPMIRLNGLSEDWGSFTAIAMTGFRERTFPGPRGRLRPAIPVDDDRARYESKHERWAPDLAGRWAMVLGDFDVALSHFWGTSREPRFEADAIPPTRLLPIYDRIHQSGLEAQATLENWLWKFEVMTRSGQGKRFGAVVAGFEYSFYGIFGSDADLGVIAEILYDGRDEKRAPVTFFEDDLFGGFRLALNDIQSAELLAGAVVDREDQTTFGLIEASRRLGEQWKLEFTLRMIQNIPERDPLEDLDRDGYAELRLSHYF